MADASSSSWVWQAEHGLYYNAAAKKWAQPQPDSSWRYADSLAELSLRHADTEQAGDLEEGEEALDEAQVWPDEEEWNAEPALNAAPLCRLVLRGQSSLLPPGKTVAAADPGEPLAIGRDKSYDRRIRLKEMAVSKTHCSIFFDVARQAWSVVDNGSTHGTWLSLPTQSGHEKEHRISEAKKASRPFDLVHQSIIRVGNTRFTVHVHASYACQDCTIATDSSNLIQTSEQAQAAAVTAGGTATPTAAPIRSKEERELDRRSQMRDLRGQLLQNRSATASRTAATSTPSTKWKDRAAERRQKYDAHEGLADDLPRDAKKVEQAARANPFGETTRGAQMLARMSGTASDASPRGLGTLVQARTFESLRREERPGLGSRKLVDAHAEERTNGEKRDWKEQTRDVARKRFKDM